MTTLPSLFEFRPGLPIEELEQELALGNQLTAWGKRKTARYLFDMHERGVHMETGHGTAVHYAKARLGMTEAAARLMLLAGRRLEELPLVDAALVAGDISWSKMILIQRVTAPETQREWLEFAEGTTCRDLESAVRCRDKGDLPKRQNESGLDDLRITVQAGLRPVNHQIWENARRKLSAELGIKVTNEDMMIQAARLILTTDAEGRAEGRSKVKHSPFQLIVHRDDDGARVHTDQGDIEIDEREAERLELLAEVVPAAAPAADPDGKTPPRMVKRVLARDNHRCQNCSRGLYLQVHHVEWRSHGGKTEEDLLVSLCSRCHSMLHEGLLVIHGDARAGFTFLDRTGTAVESATDANAVPAALRTALAAPPDSGDAHADNVLHRFLMVGARRRLAPEYGITRYPIQGWLADSDSRDSTAIPRSQPAATARESTGPHCSRTETSAAARSR